MPKGNPFDAVELEFSLDRATLAEPERVRLCLVAAAVWSDEGGPAPCEVLRAAELGVRVLGGGSSSVELFI